MQVTVSEAKFSTVMLLVEDEQIADWSKLAFTSWQYNVILSQKQAHKWLHKSNIYMTHFRQNIHGKTKRKVTHWLIPLCGPDLDWLIEIQLLV